MGFEWVLQVPILFFSIIIHEFSHGWMALWYGDDTAERAGRLTLNPLPHVDPFGTLLLPFLCIMGGTPVFGWAKPVPVNSRNLHGKKAMVKVSAVGPLSNLALALICALAFRLSFAFAETAPDLQDNMANALRFGIVLNVYLAAFNLVPVSPLDGSQVLSGLLPRRLSHQYDQHAPYGFVIIMFLLMTGLLSKFLAPFVGGCLTLLSGLGLFW